MAMVGVKRMRQKAAVITRQDASDGCSEAQTGILKVRIMNDPLT